MEKPTVISGSSLPPFSLVIVIIGGVSWLSTIYQRADQAFGAARTASDKQAQFEDKITDRLTELSERLARIEQDISYIKEQSKKRR